MEHVSSHSIIEDSGKFLVGISLVTRFVGGEGVWLVSILLLASSLTIRRWQSGTQVGSWYLDESLTNAGVGNVSLLECQGLPATLVAAS